MKLVKLILILAFGSALILWIRGPESVHIARVFPLLGGYEPGIYDLAGAIMLLTAYAGFRRLQRNEEEDS